MEKWVLYYCLRKEQLNYLYYFEVILKKMQNGTETFI